MKDTPKRFTTSTDESEDEDIWNNSFTLEEFEAVNQPFWEKMCFDDFVKCWGGTSVGLNGSCANVQQSGNSQNGSLSAKPAKPSKGKQITEHSVPTKSGSKEREQTPAAAKPQRKMYPCDACNKKSRTKYQAIIHTQTFHRGFLFLCPIEGCDHPVKTKIGLRIHIERKHTERLQDFINNLLPELVTKPEDNKNGRFYRYEIKLTTLGSPMLVKYKQKRNNNGTETESSSSSESCPERGRGTGAGRRNTRNSRIKNTEVTQNKDKAANNDAEAGEHSGNSTPASGSGSGSFTFHKSFSSMYNTFSPELKKSAKEFSFMRDVADKCKDSEDSQEQQCRNGKKVKASRQLLYEGHSKLKNKYGTTRTGSVKREPSGHCSKCGKVLSRKSDEARHWTQACPRNPDSVKSKAIKSKQEKKKK